MMSKTAKLGELLSESRILATNPDPNRRIRVKLNMLGVEKRPLENEIEGATKQFIRKAGQFIYGKQNFHKGAFGVIPSHLDEFETSADIPSFDVRNDCLPEWIYYYFKVGNRYLKLEKIARGVGSKRIHPEQIASIEIPLPSVSQQKKVVQKIKSIEDDFSIFDSELTHQLALVKQLRQAFLSEAMQGKLVESRKLKVCKGAEETGQQLLERIRKEKQELIKNGKLRKEKPLPPIKPEEIPFEIPEDWVWCRLGDLTLYSEAGKSFRCEEIEISGDEWGVIKVSAISWDTFQENQNKLYSKDLPFDITAQIKMGDFIISRANTTDLVGKSVIVETITKNLLLSDKTIRFKFSELTLPKFINLCNNSKYARNYYSAKGSGSSPSMKNITRCHMEFLLIPLPPLSTQQRIVEKLDQLMSLCDGLESSIKSSKEQNDLLLQEVLRDAMEGKDIAETNNIGKTVSFKPTNVDFYRRSVLAAEIVWQLHKEPTLGHLKLQKLIYLCQKTSEMQLPTNFLRQAMGPYDNRLMRSIDKQLKDHKWFVYCKDDILKYQPLEKAGQHHTAYLKYFESENDNIQALINKFKTTKSDTIEIVATLYACIEAILDEKAIFSEALLIKRFYEWSEEKGKFSENEVRSVFEKMKKNGIVPVGFK